MSKNEYGFSGNYSNWQEVEKLCDGYNADNILKKTLSATLKVKNKEAVFERDSVIFNKIQYSWQLLSCLFKIAIKQNSTLNITDFGGALGSHYYQNKEFLSPIKIEKWTVVEQPNYVTTGNKYIADNILNFESNLDNIENNSAILISATLQYLEKPYEMLQKITDKNFEYILFDRTAFTLDNQDKLMLQKIPPDIYEASYPHWFLNEEKFLKILQKNYNLIVDFKNSIDVVNTPSKYKGFLFERKTKNGERATND